MKQLASTFRVSMLVGLFAAACANQAEEPGPPPVDVALEELRATSNVAIQAGFDDESGKLATVRGRFELAPGLSPTDGVKKFLSRHAAILRLRPDLSDLVLEREVRDVGGTTMSWKQLHQNIPVFEGDVVVGLDRTDAIIHVSSSYEPELTRVPTQARISVAEAVRLAETALEAEIPEGGPAPELVVVRGGKHAPGLHLAWQISANLRKPMGDWLVFVDAVSGGVVRSLDMMKTAGVPCVPCNPATDAACGLVFHGNPVEVLNNTGLTDTSNVDSAQTGCLLGRLTSGTALNGTWVNTSITGSPRATPPYNYARSASPLLADEVNVYYHVDRSKQQLEQLGFPTVMGFSINTDAHDPTLGDNAHYVPSTKILEFGTGGVDDAQDGDIVHHEYGHAIQDNQVPGYGTTAEGGAAGEGFGDYWAASMTDDQQATALGSACVGAWDAVAYSPYNPGTPGSGCLRRVDSAKQYPRDLNFQVHQDGAIWSAALWRLRNDPSVGPGVADRLVIKSHTFIAKSALFINLADAMLSADTALFPSESHAAAINAAFKAGGVPRTGTPGTVTGTPQSATFSCSVASNYANYAYQECRFTQPGAAWVRLHFSSFSTENGYDFLYISDGDYRQVQRLSGQPFGTPGIGYSAVVNGDTIVARFKADNTVTAAGFTIDQAQYATAPCQTDAQCADSTVCNGAETCVAGACVAGTPLACGDTNTCTVDSCDPVSGCAHTNAPDGTACSDGDVCDGSNSCQLGSCVDTGAALNCDDGNPCTTDGCNGATGCTHSNICAPVTIATDGFESQNFAGGTGWLAAWTTAGDVSNVTQGTPRTGSRHARLRRSTGLLTRRVDLLGVTSPRLRFWSKISSFEGSDKAEVRVSSNGTTFATVKTFTSADSNNTYGFYDLDLSAYPTTSTFTIQFDAGMSGTDDIWYIDDVEVLGVR